MTHDKFVETLKSGIRGAILGTLALLFVLFLLFIIFGFSILVSEYIFV